MAVVHGGVLNPSNLSTTACTGGQRHTAAAINAAAARCCARMLECTTSQQRPFNAAVVLGCRQETNGTVFVGNARLASNREGLRKQNITRCNKRTHMHARTRTHTHTHTHSEMRSRWIV